MPERARRRATPSPPTRRSTCDELPKSIVIVGGGYIAVEFAGIFTGLGVETTLLYRGAKILRGFDEDLRDAPDAGAASSAASTCVCNAAIAAIDKRPVGATP